MTAGVDIIKDALKEIKAHSVVSPAPQETITDGMNKLNAMMQSWLTQDIDLGTIPLDVPGDDLGEPADTTNGIITNLAILMAPSAGRINGPVTVTLQKNANKQFYDIKNAYQVINIPCKGISSTVPVGQGNKKWGRRRVFTGTGATIDG